MTKQKRQTKSESRGTPLDEMSKSQEASLLSPRRAFVVQFRTPTATAPETFVGRVEHIVSGCAMRFHSPEELWAFFTRILVNVHDEKEMIP